jgi:hypothetical protein
MIKTLLKVAVASAALMAAPAMAAHDLPVGDTASPLSGAPVFIGDKLADTGLQAVSLSQFGINLNVTLRAAVYKSDTAGNLNFVYQVTNLGSSNTSVEGLTFADFGAFAIPGVWQTLTGFDVFSNGVEAADSARRIEGPTVGLDFGSTFFADVDAGANALLNPGETSAVFIVQARAPSFKLGTFTVQDGLVVRGVGFAPAVPEPATWAMMIGGFGLLGAAARRTRRATTVLA